MEVKEEKELLVTVAEHGMQLEAQSQRISDLEEETKDIKSLTLSVERLALSVQRMAQEQVEYRQRQNDLATRLLEIEQQPYKTKAGIHDKVTSQIWTLVLGAIVGFLIKTFLGI